MLAGRQSLTTSNGNRSGMLFGRSIWPATRRRHPRRRRLPAPLRFRRGGMASQRPALAHDGRASGCRARAARAAKMLQLGIIDTAGR